MKFFAKKSLGQHFLNSRHVLEQIISAANIQKGENVLEIGPGTGVLTEALLDTGAQVIAVEKDDRSIAFLTEKFSKEIAAGRLSLIHGDILEISNEPLFKSSKTKFLDSGFGFQSPSSNLPAPGSKLPASFSIVANIPYYITGAILEKFLEHEPRPNRMVLLVQKEVAKRILGPLPGGEGKESVLSISVKAFGMPKIVATVPRGSFTPPPSVDSAILSIDNLSDKPFRDNNLQISRFFEIVRAGFAHKRKYLASNLQSVLGPECVTTIWSKLKFDPKIRAENLTVQEWLEIAKCE